MGRITCSLSIPLQVFHVVKHRMCSDVSCTWFKIDYVALSMCKHTTPRIVKSDILWMSMQCLSLCDVCPVIQRWMSQLTKYIGVFWHLGPRGWLAWFFSCTQSLSLHTTYFPQPVPASAPTWLLVCVCAWEAGRSAAIYRSVCLYYTHRYTDTNTVRGFNYTPQKGSRSAF